MLKEINFNGYKVTALHQITEALQDEQNRQINFDKFEESEILFIEYTIDDSYLEKCFINKLDKKNKEIILIADI